MTGGAYTPLLDIEDPIGTISKGEVQKYVAMIKTAIKAGGKAAAAHALSAIGVPSPGSLLSLASAYSSKQHAKRLRELMVDSAYPCSCGLCEDALEFAIAQKEGKAIEKAIDGVAGFVPHGSAVKAAVKKLLDTFKKKPDWEDTPSYWAVILWGSAKPANAEIAEGDDDGRFALLSMEQDVGNCLKAFATIAELMGNYREQKSMERADAVTLIRFDIEMIKVKLAQS
jgi:hypothetical protein